MLIYGLHNVEIIPHDVKNKIFTDIIIKNENYLKFQMPRKIFLAMFL